jgi:predicted GTPase
MNHHSPSSQQSSAATTEPDINVVAEAISPEARIPRLEKIREALKFEQRLQQVLTKHLNDKMSQLVDELSRQEEIEMALETAVEQVEDIINTENEA